MTMLVRLKQTISSMLQKCPFSHHLWPQFSVSFPQFVAEEKLYCIYNSCCNSNSHWNRSNRKFPSISVKFLSVARKILLRKITAAMVLLVKYEFASKVSLSVSLFNMNQTSMGNNTERRKVSWVLLLPRFCNVGNRPVRIHIRISIRIRKYIRTMWPHAYPSVSSSL